MLSDYNRHVARAVKSFDIDESTKIKLSCSIFIVEDNGFAQAFNIVTECFEKNYSSC